MTNIIYNFRRLVTTKKTSSISVIYENSKVFSPMLLPHGSMVMCSVCGKPSNEPKTDYYFVSFLYSTYHDSFTGFARLQFTKWNSLETSTELIALYSQDHNSLANFMTQGGRSTVNFPKHAILSSIFISLGSYLSEVNNNNFTAGIHNNHEIFRRAVAEGLQQKCSCPLI